MVDATLEALASQFQTPAPFLSNYNQNETGDGASMDVFGPLLSDLTILQDYSCFCCFDELWCDRLSRLILLLQQDWLQACR